jgi:TetR/AcrR family transcriptional regulator, mexJK operon transcriptional repressor
MTVLHRERVLRAATTSFLAHGYRSSVDEIARRAGVAKQTVYHHFPNKDELFKEVARDLASRVLVELAAPDTDLRAGLQRFALAYRQRSLGAQGISAFRTLVPEVPRFRAVARAMYTNSAGEMVRRLAEKLERAMDSGELRRDDPRFAAEMLLSMLAGIDRMKKLFSVNDAGESEARRTGRIVDCFLRAYQK